MEYIFRALIFLILYSEIYRRPLLANQIAHIFRSNDKTPFYCKNE